MNFDLLVKMSSSDSEGCETAIRSVENCISVLQGDLHQPGTPAIVLKLTASWQKVKDFLSQQRSDREKLQLQEEKCKQVSNIERAGDFVSENGNKRTETPTTAAWSQAASTEVPIPSPSQSDSVGQELASRGSTSEEQLQTQSSGLQLMNIT